MCYRSLKLDTLPSMAEAQRMYARLGFVETAPYNDNPIDGVRFLCLDLSVPAGNPKATT
jgi:putative acetyltransferase